jgi:hypothetical protein
VGQPYQFGFETWGGEAPFTWALASGTLPPGLTLDVQTGLIAGQPTAAGSETFTVRVTDSAIASQAQRLRTYVSAPVTIDVH